MSPFRIGLRSPHQGGTLAAPSTGLQAGISVSRTSGWRQTFSNQYKHAKTISPLKVGCRHSRGESGSLPDPGQSEPAPRAIALPAATTRGGPKRSQRLKPSPQRALVPAPRPPIAPVSATAATPAASDPLAPEGRRDHAPDRHGDARDRSLVAAHSSAPAPGQAPSGGPLHTWTPATHSPDSTGR